jgi:hypothetical protein
MNAIVEKNMKILKKYYKIAKYIIFFLFICYLLFFNKKKYLNNNIMKKLHMDLKLYDKKYKNQILELMSKSLGQKITSVKSIFLAQKSYFGNQILILSDIIFICEILGCKRIILDKKYFWYIKNKIIDRKFKRIIDIGDIKDYLNTSTIIDKTSSFFQKLYINRMNLLRNEILNNLPKIVIKPNALYIYIRSSLSGSVYNPDYFQPPLCFYKTILNNYKFKKVNLIAKDKTNKMVDVLLNNFKFIIFKEKSLKEDIAYLIYAYNIVGLSSSFLYSIMNMNYNLRLYWHYGEHGFRFIPNIEATIFKMEPSNEYSKQIYYWKYNSSQFKLMINDNCPNKFEIEN